MELKDAKKIIEQAINAGLLKGVYSLEDAKVIIQALDKLNSQPDVEFGTVSPISK